MEAIAFIALMPVLAVMAIIGFVLWKVVVGIGWVLAKALRLAGKLVMRVLRFARGSFVQGLHMIGAGITLAAVLPLTLANLLIGRWDAAKHYASGLEDEVGNLFGGLYRLAIVGPARFLGLGPTLGRVQRRVGDLVDHAPRRERRFGRRSEQQRTQEPANLTFPGYEVLDALPSGGSGAKLYLARPKADTVARLTRAGRRMPDRVVIKSFALDQGSTLPQIVRESRALEAASKLGLVLEHDLQPDRFCYVTRYVEGDELNVVGNRLHARSGPEGLGAKELALVLGYAQDLVRSLHGFHAGGLWHKDVKPANVIVANDRAHLVDFGLVTPLASALTLTTHGTEYYRDPEMVRLALQGVRVHEVDGVKFDLYSTGAVLYSLVEDSFPAQGSLSRVTKRAPEALKWIIRRSMADIHARYGSAAAMLADLDALALAPDPFAMRPADLPSFRGETPPNPEVDFAGFASGDASTAFRAPQDSEGEAREPLRPLRARVETAEEVPAPRRRRRRRVAMAAGLLLLASFVVARKVEEEGHGERWRRSLETAGTHLSAYDYATLEEAQRTLNSVRSSLGSNERKDLVEVLGALDWWDRATRAAEPKIRRKSTKRHPQQVVESHRPRRVRQENEPGLSLPWSGEQVLLVEDLQGDDERVVEVFERLLRERGVDVLGTGHEADDLSLVAGARHAAGLGGPEDPESFDRLGTFLAEHPELAGLVWVAPSLRDKTPVVLMVPRPSQASAGRGGLFRLEGMALAQAQ